MLDLLKNKIKNNTSLYYFAKMLKNAKNTEFINKVIELGESANNITVQHKGEKNRGSVVYFAELGYSTTGFFAIFRMALDVCAYADYFGFKPIIAFNKETSYCEDHPINGTTNPFEYYFEQPCFENGFFYDVVDKSCAVVKYELVHSLQLFNLYGINQPRDYNISSEQYSLYAQIYKKYIKFNKITEERLNSHLNALGISESDVIGVHYRGTDYKNNYGSHPVSIQVEDYYPLIDDILKEKPDAIIFLATDDNEALSDFCKRYESKIVYYRDTERSDGNVAIICKETHRENNKYELGYEVIRDAYTLSQCKFLIAGLSQVSTAARIMKKSRGIDFEKDILMNKGINHNNRSHVDDMNKIRDGAKGK